MYSQSPFTKPTVVEIGFCRFFIFNMPNDENLPVFLSEMKKERVSHVVGVEDVTYNKELVEKEGIKVHVWPFKDGHPPPDDVVDEWLSLVESVFGRKSDKREFSELPAIGVHCTAGLGRAPLLVAIAMIEFCGVKALDAIGIIRKKRRGAINTLQMHYLEAYKPRLKKKCCIM
eukprot:TRINITY_DN354_c0_g1_i1.p1 TRINITY_DN354_c0_g1~~TRINITY_DN354_c0_g1_i1.p1  ORF type:complete len:173 (-),score=54.55 TRINITY_DN354_c0_g1_i1:303-821(-)